MIAEDVLGRLEKVVVPYGGSVEIEYTSPMNDGTLPWSCMFGNVGDPGEKSWAEGTGNTLLEAIDDALDDLERSREPA